MSFDTVRKSSETLLNNWAGLPIAYDGIKFDSKAQSEWVRIIVADGDSFEIAINSNCVRHTGLIVIQIFTNQWDGSASARRYADEISALFKGVRDNGVIYRAAVLSRVGHDGDYYQLNLSIPFEFDTTT